jgi:hypothetical protein
MQKLRGVSESLWKNLKGKLGKNGKHITSQNASEFLKTETSNICLLGTVGNWLTCGCLFYHHQLLAYY